MKQYLYYFFFLILFLFYACRDESSALGGKWLESSFRNVYTDTCTVRLSTMLLDSLNTSGGGVAQIGFYADEYWGQISASSYLEFNYTSFTPDENATYVFDSLTLCLAPNHDYLGDTLQGLRIHLHQLTENLELYTNGYLFNTSSVAYDPLPFTTLSFKISPNINEVTEIALPEELGMEWFTKILDNKNEFTSQDNFRQYFPGIAFIPEESSCKSITGLMMNDSSMCIKLYYHRILETSVEQILSFTPSSTQNFNKVKYDRSNTPLEQLTTENKELMSSLSSNQTYVQGLTGLYTKIEFPYLNFLLEEGDMVTIESARLYLYPVRGSYGGAIPLPDNLSLYTADENNVTGSAITDILGTSVQNGSLTTDDLLHRNTYYTFDITTFLQGNLGAIGINKQSLQLFLPEDKINTSFSSVQFGDMEHPESQVQLSILCKIYTGKN